MQERYCLQMVACDGGCGNGNSGDGNPVGTVISYMGTTVPKHYLKCDGALLNVADYPKLTQQIQTEFGAVGYFGGDGLTTFAVPDLRNEFLRGYGGEAEEQLSGEIGEHQEATAVPNFYISDYGKQLIIGIDKSDMVNTAIEPKNFDKGVAGDYGNTAVSNLSIKASASAPNRMVSVRPMNMAVLYCIKYE